MFQPARRRKAVGKDSLFWRDDLAKSEPYGHTREAGKFGFDSEKPRV